MIYTTDFPQHKTITHIAKDADDKPINVKTSRQFTSKEPIKGVENIAPDVEMSEVELR